MLYLNPPYYYIDGVSILPDHADKRQWYFMPLYPRFSTNPGTGDLQLAFLKFRGQAGNGGFLNFDANIGIDQSALDTVAAKFKAAAGLDDTPNLSPVPLIDGTVRLILFDQQTPVSPPTGTGKPGPDPAAIHFVEKILQATKPSLYGDNQAVFSTQLTDYGVTVLDQALRGTMTPMAVIYDLDYVALRPAFQVKLTVDWDRVYHYVDQMQGVDGVFVSAQIDKAVSDLKDQRAIVMEADLFVPEGEDASTVVSDFNRAESEVREMFTDAFFKPSIEPTKESQDGWDKAADFANRFGRYATTGGVSSLFTFTKKEVDLTQIDHKSINANLQERTAVRRSIHPQGHLSGIAAVLAGDPSKYITSVDLDNDFFKLRTITASSVADFDGDELASIHVQANYGGTPHDVLLDSANSTGAMTWEGQLVGGVFQWPVTYDYEVTFRNVDTSQRPMQISTKGQPGWPKTTTDEKLVIAPRADLYTIVDVPIHAEAVPFAEWPTVEVDVSYVDDVNKLKQLGHFVLDATWAATNQSVDHWKMFVLDKTKTSFTYQITYIAPDNSQTTMPAVETDDEQVQVPNPYPPDKKRTLQIVPNFDWTKVDRAFADVSYNDPNNNVSQNQSYEFNSKKTDTQTFVVDLSDIHVRQVQYSVTIIFKDGHTVQVPPSYTLLPRIILRTDMIGHRVITIHTDQVSFASVGLTKLDVDLRFTDARAGISAEDTFTLTSPSDVAHFEYDYVDAAHSAYEYQATYHYDSGMSKSPDAQTSDHDDLSLPVS